LSLYFDTTEKDKKQNESFHSKNIITN